MSPALEAATATMVPTVSTAARAPTSVQPKAAKTLAVPRRVTSVIPEVGCDDTPMMPTMRAATETNSTPKIPTPRPQIARWSVPSSLPKTCGTSPETRTTTSTPPRTKMPGRSRSRSGESPASSADPGLRLPRSPRVTASTERVIAGRLRSTVRMPATATAPAPM